MFHKWYSLFNHSVILEYDKKAIPGSRENKPRLHTCIVNPPGKRAHFCMSIMKEVHSKNYLQLWQKWHFQLNIAGSLTSYKQKKLPFQVWMTVQSFPCQGTSWSPVMEENWTDLSKSTEERWKKWLSYWKMWRSTIPHSSSPMGLL